MNRAWLWFALALCPLSLAAVPFLSSAPAPRPEPHRSPIDVAVLPGGQRALTANHTADSATLIDLAEGKVLAEQPCGHKPAGVACSRDGKRAAVSNLWSGTVTLLEVRDTALETVATMSVGSQPRGVVFAADGGSVFVAVAGANEVVQVEWASRKLLQRWPAATEPRRLALSRDGRFLAAVSTRSAQVRCWDTQTGKQVIERTINDAFNLHSLAFSPDDRGLVTAHLHDRHRAIEKNTIAEGWVLDDRLSKVTLEENPRSEYWQIAMDVRAEAVGDPSAVAFSAGGWLAVAAAGTHELVLFKAAAVPWNSGEPGDLLDSLLAVDPNKFRRVALGGRPMAVEFVDKTDTAVVANYLLDALQVVDVNAPKLVRTIPLGGPAQPSLARRGEAIFYDAQRSHHQWFSCHTCHADGHTTGRTFDTLNDDSYGNPKLTPTLRGVTKTGPWTWHGWQNDLGQAVEKSLTDTLFGSKPAAGDIEALLAFLGTLDHPPNPHLKADGTMTEAAERGKALFQGKAKCARCHQGDHYTAPKNFDVKIDGDGSRFPLWNPPSLRGLNDRGPYLHDGRAETLDQVLRGDHAPEKLGADALTPEERRDLIEFLKSL